MKKTFKISSVFLAGALLLAGCSEPAAMPKDYKKVKLSIGEEVQYDKSQYTIYYNGKIDGDDVFVSHKKENNSVTKKVSVARNYPFYLHGKKEVYFTEDNIASEGKVTVYLPK